MASHPVAETLKTGVVILAAGASSRMGRPKLLLPWAKTSVLGHLIEQWNGVAAAQIAVVCADADQGIDVELTRLGFPQENRVHNPTPELGMFSSIQSAARWSGWRTDLTHWIIVLGDQPHLLTATLRALLEFAAAQPHRICQPSRHGRPRHPVVLPAAAFWQLRGSVFPNLKAFLHSNPAGTSLREMDDPGLDFDIDEPADYERALRLFSHND